MYAFNTLAMPKMQSLEILGAIDIVRKIYGNSGKAYSHVHVFAPMSTCRRWLNRRTGTAKRGRRAFFRAAAGPLTPCSQITKGTHRGWLGSEPKIQTPTAVDLRRDF